MTPDAKTPDRKFAKRLVKLQALIIMETTESMDPAVEALSLLNGLHSKPLPFSYFKVLATDSAVVDSAEVSDAMAALDRATAKEFAQSSP